MNSALRNRLLILSCPSPSRPYPFSARRRRGKRRRLKHRREQPLRSAEPSAEIALPTIKFEKYTLSNGLVVILSKTIACRWSHRTSGIT